MRIVDCKQGEQVWLAARCGVPSSSQFDRIITQDGTPSKQRSKYLLELAGERLTGKPQEIFKTGPMQRGTELEPEAREFYEMVNKVDVEQVGFCVREEEFTAGCSPDGLLRPNGGMEIKCPTAPVHISYVLGNKLPSEYFHQVQGSLFITGFEWWDFFSYFPSIRPLQVRVEPDFRFHAMLKAALIDFCAELDSIVTKLKGA